MGEIRRDYLLNRWVVIAPSRESRPQQFEKSVEIKEEKCFFCPGNEDQTTPTTGQLPKEGDWNVRWFQNKFPSLQGKFSETKTNKKYFTSGPASGRSEIIVETRDHTKKLAELSADEISWVIQAYKDRITDLSSEKNISYVTVFKNSGPDAGTSIVHSHSQVMASSLPNKIVAEEVAARKKVTECPYCEIVSIEKKGERRCFENGEWVAFAPYASRFSYECWIFPKKHITSIEDVDSETLAVILKQVLSKISELKCSYNYVIHYSPKEEDLHLHIEVMPRLHPWGGFEFGSGITVNTVSPENAGKFYRGEQ